MALPWVMVDNTDPRIEYSPASGWTSQTSNISDLPNFLIRPMYGTYHEYRFVQNATVTLNFTGVAVMVMFLNTETAFLGSCTVDNQLMEVAVERGLLECFSSNNLQPGSHIVTVSGNLTAAKPLLFDYIVYDPGEGNLPATDADLLYGSLSSSVKISSSNIYYLGFPGDTLDFIFVGYSVGLYGTPDSNDTQETVVGFFSYSIDGNTPVNFTTKSDPTNREEAEIMLQTPRDSQSGQHHLHLDYFGNDNSNHSTLSLTPNFFIVQNMNTPHVSLDPLPPNPSTTQPPSNVSIVPMSTPSTILTPLTSATPSTLSAISSVSAVPIVHTVSSESDRQGPIIGGTTAGAIILLLFILTFFIYRRRHLQLSTIFGGTDNSNNNPIVEPFQLQQDCSVQSGSRKNRGTEGQNNSVIDIARPEDPDVEPNFLIEPFHHWRAHFRSFRKHRLGILQRHSDRDNVLVDTHNPEANPITQMARQRRLRYQVHEDSGERITQPDEGSIVVDLPPTYATIRFTESPPPPPDEEPVEMMRNEGEASEDATMEDDPGRSKVNAGGHHVLEG